jgi:hypothetical protein
VSWNNGHPRVARRKRIICQSGDWWRGDATTITHGASMLSPLHLGVYNLMLLKNLPIDAKKSRRPYTTIYDYGSTYIFKGSTIVNQITIPYSWHPGSAWPSWPLHFLRCKTTQFPTVQCPGINSTVDKETAVEEQLTETINYQINAHINSTVDTNIGIP